MHLGNVYAAYASYRAAKARGGLWVLRIEDNDPQRSRQEWADWIMDDLHWLGLDWDEGPYYQSRRLDIYDHYLHQLDALQLLYPCRCTRAERNAASAPHDSDGNIVYNGKCRSLWDGQPALAEDANIRLIAQGRVSFNDTIHGPQSVDLSSEIGDFIVRRRDGAPAYQAATAIDDALMNITQVVRGDDLLLSTAPQRYIQSLLSLPAPEEYTHIPLLRSADGRRLSKRDHSLSMEYLREHCTAEEVLNLIRNEMH